MKTGNFCPLIRKDCIENKCRWFCQVRGTNPNTGEPMDQWQCAINLLPVLLIENGRQQHSTASAIESFRNETVNRTDTTNLLLHAITNQTARIEPTQVTLLPEDSAG